MKVLELFSGTESFSKIFKERGHEVFTIDNDPQFEPSLCADIMDVTPELIREKFGQPDVIWASPPCQCFSVASIRHYWTDGKPKNEKVLRAIDIVKRTLWLIDELKPRFWFIENPRGMLRKQSFMPSYKRKFITYCQYGLPYMKPTDIWTNLYSWQPKSCKPIRSHKHIELSGRKHRGRDFVLCHTLAPRGSKTGIQGITCGQDHRGAGCGKGGKDKHPADRVLRAVVPRALCEEIYDEIEKAEQK